VFTDGGKCFFNNKATKQSTWQLPREVSIYLETVDEEERKRLFDATSQMEKRRRIQEESSSEEEDHGINLTHQQRIETFNVKLINCSRY
jgi:hypothetical protein